MMYEYPTFPQEVEKKKVSPLFWVFALSGGVITMLASFLPWLSMQAPIVGQRSETGISGGDGWISFAAGVLLLGYAVLSLTGAGKIRRSLSVPALIVSLGVITLGIFEIVNIHRKVAEAKAAMLAEDDEFGIAKSMAAAFDVQIGNGLWLLIAAGIVSAVYAFYRLLVPSVR